MRISSTIINNCLKKITEMGKCMHNIKLKQWTKYNFQNIFDLVLFNTSSPDRYSALWFLASKTIFSTRLAI